MLDNPNRYFLLTHNARLEQYWNRWFGESHPSDGWLFVQIRFVTGSCNDFSLTLWCGLLKGFIKKKKTGSDYERSLHVKSFFRLLRSICCLQKAIIHPWIEPKPHISRNAPLIKISFEGWDDWGENEMPLSQVGNLIHYFPVNQQKRPSVIHHNY